MRLITLLAVLAFLPFQAGQPTQNPSQQQRQNPPAGLEGFVLQAASGDPVAKAQVSLARVVTPPAVPPTAANPLPPNIPIPPATTDASGKFSFANLEPGSYRLNAGRNGFVRMNYGERFSGGPGTVIEIPSGQTLKDVTFRLIPTAAISGRIRDTSGEPAGGLTVQLMKTSYNANGQRSFQGVASGRTDDRGEYRLFWISPGRYYLSVSASRNSFNVILDNLILSSGASLNEVGATGQPAVFYPGTVDPARASAIEVGAGRDLQGVDMVLPTQPGYRVRGRVVDSSTGQPPRSAGITLIQRDSAFASLGNAFTGPNYNPTNGTFELRDVAPGTYWLRAQASDSSAAATITPNLVGRSVSEALQSVTSARSAGQISLDVAGDLEGVVLSLSAGITVAGNLRVEGAPLPAGTSLRITLRATATNGVSSPLQLINPDGTFTLTNVFPGEYRVMTLSMPQDYYIKEARNEQTDVLNQPWVIGNSIRGNLDVVISSDAGQIQGTVTDARSQPVSSIQTMLLPDQDRDRTELVRSTVSDQNGKFTIRGIPPGNYKLFAWDGLESNAFFDPEVMRQYEQQGKAVRVEQGAKLTTDVKVTPVKQ